jgi:HK97 family phage major capsid protein
MTSTYLEDRTSRYEDLTDQIDGIYARATEDGRDINDTERAEIERVEVERSQVEASINLAAAGAESRARVAQKLRSIPQSAPRQTVVRDGHVQVDEAAQIMREIAGSDEVVTPGHWAAMVHRAWVKRDKGAAELLERATAHQVVADNLGLVPKQVVAPVVDRMRSMRPLIASVTSRTPPGPKFDRPIVTQQVDVGAQVAEKDLTASRKLLVGTVEVTLQTHAGHLNISKQDIRWSQPNILNLVYESFGKMYARVSDSAACSEFVTKVTATQEIAGAIGTYTASAIDAAIGAAGTTIAGATGDNGELNHIWVSRDVGIALSSLRNANTGQKLYNVPLINGTSGDLDGIPVTVDPRFAAATFIVGDDSLVEFWEDLEGFMSVDEPDVLGQMVGYAGYNRLAVLDATGFVKLTNIAALTASASAAKK